MDQNLYTVLMEAVRLLFIAIIPVLIAISLAGLLVGTMQAATTIYDVALGYTVRVVAVILVIYIFFPSISQSMVALTELALR